MKILVTGGAGMIGSNLSKRLLEMGHSVIVIDNLWRGNISNIERLFKFNENFTFINADLAHFGEWVNYFKNIDCVYHLADIVAGIGYVFSNESYIFRKNLQINCNVTTACETMSVGRYVYVGTACSFPKEIQFGIDAPPMQEKSQFPANPESAYGWSKLMGELDADYLTKSSRINSVVLVLHNVYGNNCDFKSNRAQVIPSLIYRTIMASQYNKGKIEVWGDGSQGRAFVHVADVVNALCAALVTGHGEGPIQIGPDICTSIKEVANLIVQNVDSSLGIFYDSSKPMGDLGRCADYSKAKQILNWSPTVNLNEGISDLVNWIRSQNN